MPKPASRFTLIPAVHLLLLKDDQILLLRRFNTGYEDGNYSVPAGHVEGGETATAAMCREAKEEAGLTIRPADLKFVHVMHRITDAERLDLFFAASTWEGEPTNREPEKCDQLRWFPMASLPANMIPYVRQAITHVQDRMPYSEHGWLA